MSRGPGGAVGGSSGPGDGLGEGPIGEGSGAGIGCVGGISGPGFGAMDGSDGATVAAPRAASWNNARPRRLLRRD